MGGYILGLGGPYHHDASACLLGPDGRIVAFAEEERFSRRKHHKDSRSCTHAVAYCLAAAGISLDDVDEVAIAFNPTWPTLAEHSTDPDLIHELLDLDRLGGTLTRLTIVGHHLAHAASGFYPAGVDDAAVLVVDGSGDGISTSLWHGTTGGLKLLREYPFTQSLGWFYQNVAEHLGLGDWTTSGKVMGLAAYGTPRYDLDFLTGRDDGYLLDLTRYGLAPGRDATADYTNLAYYYDLKRAYRAAYTDLGVPAHHRRAAYDPGTGRLDADTGYRQEHADLAASAQHTLEQQLLVLAKAVLRDTGSSQLCIAGGVGLNCSANGVLHRHAGAANLFVQPAAGDAGCAIGAALECARRANSLRLPGPRMTSAALGPAFTDAQIAAVLRGYGIEYTERGENIAAETASLIAQGNVVGWFQGAAEAGPRALGGRSILADPGLVATRDRINRSIKRREMWRPLAPSIHTDAAVDLLSRPGPADFMIVAHQATDTAWARIPATVHVDGTVRPQVVDPARQPRYAALLSHVGDQTGTPAVLNTSFNHEAEPVVCTPTEALRTFFSTPLDALAIGGFLVTKKPSRHRTPDAAR